MSSQEECAHCGKNYISHRTWSRYCSVSCKVKTYRRAHPEKVKKWYETYKNYRNQLARSLRAKVLRHYGHTCQCCGESHYEFLAIDHINGDGNKFRREVGMRSADLCRWIIKHQFPQHFQILCHNCNMAKAFYAYCPHQQKNSQDAQSFAAPINKWGGK